MKETRESSTGTARKKHWVELGVAFGSLIALSFVLAYLFGRLTARVDITQYQFAGLAYLVIFGVSLISNLTIVAPVPFALAIMVAASARWNPGLIALAGAVGGTIGELSGYFAGYFGVKIAIPRRIPGHNRIERWVQKYGMWAIFLLALQPIIPFDIGGLIAGAAKMPMHKFLPALFLGKTIKYLGITYAGAGIINFFPLLSQR